jgi:hypothetical protein|tara:strand:- start:2239 stop:2580 length:342 start_codon:yes stop_codon:yes gene_type:complete
MTRDNIKFFNPNVGEKMIKQMLDDKGKEYGNFGNNAHIVAGFIKHTLEAINKQHLKVPTSIVPQLMIVLKLTRTVDDGTKQTLYKEDTFKDIAGYSKLLEMMMKHEEDYKDVK